MPEMRFTYNAYVGYLKLLKTAGYSLTRFQDARTSMEPKAIIRHDIDLSPKSALKMAELDYENGCLATYFVLISSTFFNLLDKDNEASILKIASLGHEIGLHFDVTKYADADGNALQAAIEREIDLLSAIIGKPVKSMSWHIPRRDLIGKRLPFLEEQGILNAYDPEFFDGYKYCSDSMMRWRDPLVDYVDCVRYPKLQVLTHPISYAEEERSDIFKLGAAFIERQTELIEYLERNRPGISEFVEAATLKAGDI